MKIRIALIDSDDLYLQRFVSTFNSKYFDKITIFSFSDPAIAESNMQMSKYDIVIAAENFDLTPFKDRCAVAYFSNSNEINELNGEKAIGKYQRVENIYKQILDLYSEIHKGIIYNDNGGDNGTKIIGVFSACGGAGATSVASAYARALAARGESVLYFDLEKNNCNHVFKGEGQQVTFGDVVYAIKSQNANLGLKLESCVKHDPSGVYFYEPCESVLDFLELNDEEILDVIRTLKAAGKYTYMIVDFNFDFAPLHFELMKLMYKTFVVSLGTDNAIAKLRSLARAFELKEEQENFPYIERMNLVYNRFTNETSLTADELRIKIAGGVPDFGNAPFEQTVLKIALALAESAYDLNQLCLGKSVPLYKSSTTWAMSPQGMIGIAKEEGKKLIEKSTKYAEKQLNNAITNVFDKIEKTANGKISEITDDVTKYMNQTIRDVSDKVINATVTPFMNGIKGVLGKMDSSWGKDKIKAELQNCLDKLKEGSTDDNYGKCKTIAIEYLEGKVSEVADTIYDSLQEASGVKSDVIIGKINNLFKHIDSATNTETGYIAELNNKLTAEITKLSEGLQNEVTKALNSTEDNAKEKLNEAINNFSNGITEKYTSAVDKVGEAAPNSNTVGDVTNSKAATISLNYKEYLYAFMLIGILANEDNMVARTGYLMQMNISQKMTDAGFEDSDRENFDMTKMYTMVQIHSEADVDSVFMGMFEKKTVNGEESYSLNLDGNGASTDKLVYNGFIGY